MGKGTPVPLKTSRVLIVHEDNEFGGFGAEIAATIGQQAFLDLFQGENDVLPVEVDATLSAEIWLERDLGTPVSLRVVGVDSSGAEVVRLELDLMDLNSEDITVEAPE